MNAFHVLGGVLALWALVVTALGLRGEGFPGKRWTLVSAASVLLVAGAMVSAVVSSAVEEQQKAAEEKHKLAEEHRARGGAPPAPVPGTSLQLTADPGGKLQFDKQSLEAPAGPVTIAMANPSPLSHNVVIEGNGVEQEGVTVGTTGTSTVSANLRPGTYSYYCSVLGHHEGGMEGTLTVR